MRIAVLSNVNLDLLIKTLSKRHEVFQSAGYGQWITYALTKDKGLSFFKPEIIFLILDGNELFDSCNSDEEAASLIRTALGYVESLARNYPDALVATSDLDIRQKSVMEDSVLGREYFWQGMWCQELLKLSGKMGHIYRLPLQEMIASKGRDFIYFDKLWYMGSIPYSTKSLPAFVELVDGFIRHMLQPRKKLLAVDLDNTIWGGVVGEDGPLGIELGTSKTGAIFRDVQKRLKAIKEYGALLAVVSKNNPDDVDDVFEKNSHMVLKKDDFVSIICNWDNKSENLRSLAERLNLGLSSFVFLDDNPAERGEVTSNAPEVVVVDFPSDIALLPKVIDDIWDKYFWAYRSTEEDLEKTEQYRHEEQRNEARTNASSYEDYLRRLQIRISISEVKEWQIERTVQLINKTNQFNTNMLRFDRVSFENYVNSPGHRVYVADVSDKFGDSGLVVVLMIHVENHLAIIDNFLMSCRVMGRQIENAIIGAVSGKLKGEDVDAIRASWSRSSKNKPVEDLYDKLGFTCITSTADERVYQADLPLRSYGIADVEWV